MPRVCPVNSATCASTDSGWHMMNPMEPEPNADILSIMPADRVVESYHSRKLEALSETQLFRAAAHIVSQPKLKLSSFRLHAPLEIMARFTLLPLVSDA